MKNAQAQEGHQTVVNWNYYTLKSFNIVNFIGNFPSNCTFLNYVFCTKTTSGSIVMQAARIFFATATSYIVISYFLVELK